MQPCWVDGWGWVDFLGSDGLSSRLETVQPAGSLVEGPPPAAAAAAAAAVVVVVEFEYLALSIGLSAALKPFNPILDIVVCSGGEERIRCQTEI